MKRLNLAILAGALVCAACAPSSTVKASRSQTVPPAAAKTSLQRLEAKPSSQAGARLYQMGYYRRSASEFERVLEVETADYRAAYMLGMSHLKRGRYEDARDAFRLALELGPDRKTACHIHNGLAYSYESMHQTRMAHHHYHLACQFNKANGYAQAGAARTEYRDRSEPKPRPVARGASQGKRSTG